MKIEDRIILGRRIKMLYNNRRYFVYDSKGYLFYTPINVTDSTGLYTLTNIELIETYEELKNLGKFTDQEITILALKLGPIRPSHKKHDHN